MFDSRRRTGNDTAMSVGSSMMEQSAIIPEIEQPVIEADPDEPRYCICNEVAFGDMVACDYKKVRLSDFIWSMGSPRVYGANLYFSAPTNGITIHALASLVHQKETGTALSVL